MKRILIVIGNMNIGGIQKSLLELLKALSERGDVEVSLFCCNRCGDFLSAIPKNINVLPQNKWAAVAEKDAAQCKTAGIGYYLFRLAASLWTKVFNKKIPSALLCCLIGNLGEYDVAVSYSQPLNEKAFCNLTNEVVLNCCNAKKKVTFVHCDFRRYGGNSPLNRGLYKKFDTVAAVSDSVGGAIKECISEINVKTVYNFCDKDEILKLAADNTVEYGKKTIVTVARISEEKGILRSIPIMAKLKENGFDFEWHIVGGGPLETKITNMISQYNLCDTVFLEGMKINPYRYMKNADCLFVPSYHEAAPMVFDEAAILQLAVLTTDTLSAKELVENRKIGIVCDNDDDAIYNMLYKFLNGEYNKFDGYEFDAAENMARFDAVCKVEE